MAVAAGLSVGITILLYFGHYLVIYPTSSVPAYTSRLFDNRQVHTIDLQVEDWSGFITSAPEETYTPTLREQTEQPGAGVNAAHLRLQDPGDFEDLENAKERNDAALTAIS